MADKGFNPFLDGPVAPSKSTNVYRGDVDPFASTDVFSDPSIRAAAEGGKSSAIGLMADPVIRDSAFKLGSSAAADPFVRSTAISAGSSYLSSSTSSTSGASTGAWGAPSSDRVSGYTPPTYVPPGAVPIEIPIDQVSPKLGTPLLSGGAANSSSSGTATGAVGASGTEEPKGCCWFLTPAVLKPFFNVDTDDILQRMLFALFPFRRTTSFLRMTDIRNDLYGPWWICTTLVFLIGALSNVISWLKFTSGETQTKWHYDLSLLTYSAAVCYGYIVIVPLLLLGTSYWLSIKLRFLQILCLYGYSLTPFLPAAVLSVVPFEWFEWIMIAIALGVSLFFLLQDLWPVIKEGSTARALPIALVLSAAHCAFALTLRIWFF